METESLIGQRWSVMRGVLDERQRRLLVATEAKVLGRGGVSAVCVATGVSRTTIMVGLSEIEAMQSRDDTEQQTQILTTSTRQSGGGRKKLETKTRPYCPTFCCSWIQRPAATLSHHYAGRARVCATWPTNSRQEATQLVTL